MLYDLMKSESVRLSREMANLEKKIAALPDGKLVIVPNGRYYKWFVSDGKKDTYIKKDDKDLARNLARKKVLIDKLEYLKKDKFAIEAYLRHANVSPNWNVPIYPGLADLLDEEDNDSGEAFKWANESFESNELFTEKLTFETVCGIYVRSKAESMICDALYHYKIPFRYEWKLELDSEIVYPDFTLMHPKTLVVKRWEHFGRMDDPDYVKRTYRKLFEYNSNGYILGRNLLATFETKNEPLSSAEIDRMIRLYYPDLVGKG